MPKVPSRQKMLTEGLRLIHERGYAGAGIREITKAAGVSPGTFTGNFASKEAFGLEILELYFARSSERSRLTLRNESLKPLKRLKAFIVATIGFLEEHGLENGCVLVNFSIEAGPHSEKIRHRLVEMFGEIRKGIANVLKAAVKAGELPRRTKCDELAGFVMESFHGAIAHSKAERSREPLDRFVHFLFSSVLR